MTPKWFFFEFWKNFVINFSRKYSEIKTNIVIDI